MAFYHNGCIGKNLDYASQDLFIAVALFLAIVIDCLFVIEEITFFKPLYNLPDGGLFSLTVKFVKKFGVFVLFLVERKKTYS